MKKKLKLKKKSSTGKSRKPATPRSKQKQTTKAVPSRKPRKLKIRKGPRTSGEFFALPAAEQDTLNRVAQIVQDVRKKGISVTKAAKQYFLEPKNVIETAGPALHKKKNGRYVAKKFDRLLRVLNIPAEGGTREVAVRDSRTASKLGEYDNAVGVFLLTGDESILKKFRRLRLTDAEGNRIKLLTDAKELIRLGSAGAISFESLYARVA